MSLLTDAHRPTLGVLAGWQVYWTATPLSYLDPIVRGICAAAQDHDCNILLAGGLGSAPDAPRPAWPSRSAETDFVPIGPWNTSGLIVVNPLLAAERSHYIHGLRAAGHPILYIGSGEGGPAIVADNASGIRAALGHLAAHGHRQIAFIAGNADDLEGDSGHRLRAYHSGLQELGLTANPSLIAYGRHYVAGGQHAMQEILASGSVFTAVVASNDESAMGAMRALREAGRRIPDDVAVIGFDDRLEAAIQTPALTTVHVPLFTLGYQAVVNLLRHIAGQAPLADLHPIPTRLIIRQSCGCQLSTVLAPADDSTRIAQQMAEAVLIETQRLSAEEVRQLCQRLVAAFEDSLRRDDPSEFQQTLAEVLWRAEAMGDDAHLWQAAISGLRAHAAPTEAARALLDQARVTVSTAMWHQHRRSIVEKHWTLGHLGWLTMRLVKALDQQQIYEVLAQHLPEMGIPRAAVAFFEAEADDPVYWCQLRLIPDSQSQPVRFPSRAFPPAALRESGFRLALLPFNQPHGPSGFVALEAVQIELHGAIVQQLAAALNTVELYHAALDGRRLAEEANRLQSRFLSTVSHELRTPLNLIVGLSEMLLREGEGSTPLPNAQRRDMERIHASAQQLGWLIRDVLDLASSDAGQLRLTNEYLDLGEILQVAAETGQQLAQDKGLAWHSAFPEAEVWVWGDRTRLRQVALNLVSNAIKFTANGSVSLRVEAQGGSVSVSVHDTGLGIAPDEQAAIFDEFRRSERSLARGYGGLGLGLAICKRLIELHGGQIGVTSSGAEGDGATFYFTLPQVAPPTPSVAPMPIALILTHHLASGEQLRAALQQRGITARLAHLQATDWLPQLSLSPPDVFVLDMNPNSECGWEVLQTLKRNPTTQHLPVMFCRLSAQGGAVLELDYLTKPIGLNDLNHALDQHDPAGVSEAKTILIVDDDANTVEMHARLIQARSAQHRLLKARNGREALALLQTEQADLVLLDLMMPELDGFEVLQAMRAQVRTQSIPVIVLTGQLLTADDMARLNRGVATVLSKGLFTLEETLAHITRALDRKRLLSSNAQRLVRQAMAYLHAHYAEPVTREVLARQVGMSDDYLTACFRQELGMTPIAYLNRYRVNQAKALLADPDKTITEIAWLVGFSDSGYFSRVFRREVGASPEAFRRGADHSR